MIKGELELDGTGWVVDGLVLPSTEATIDHAVQAGCASGVKWTGETVDDTVEHVFIVLWGQATKFTNFDASLFSSVQSSVFGVLVIFGSDNLIAIVIVVDLVTIVVVKDLIAVVVKLLLELVDLFSSELILVGGAELLGLTLNSKSLVGSLAHELLVAVIKTLHIYTFLLKYK